MHIIKRKRRVFIKLGNYEMSKQFDFIIGNPPYKKNLHLEFLKKSYSLLNITGQLLYIHPGIWLYAQKPGKTLNIANEVKTLIGNHFQSFDIINGNSFFDIGLFGPCVITHINKTLTEPLIIFRNKFAREIRTYPSSFDVNPFFDDHNIFNSIKEKIWNYCSQVDNIDNHINVNPNQYYVNLELIVGHIDRTSETRFTALDFYDMILPKNRVVTSKPLKTLGNKKQWISFGSKEEAQEFLDYAVDSKLAKFALMIVKVGQHLYSGKPLKYVPYFADHLYELLNLTSKEINFIEFHVDNFYEK